MLGRKEKNNTTIKINTTRGNKSEGADERRKTKKILRQDQYKEKRTFQNNERKFYQQVGEEFTDRAFNIIADFMGCSMNLTVAGQRPSVQNSIVVLFPDIFMNFWLLSYRNLNRYVI